MVNFRIIDDQESIMGFSVYSGHTDPTIPVILTPPWRGGFLRTKL